MCCRTRIFPLDKDFAKDILRIGLFLPESETAIEPTWVRLFPEEGSLVRASFASSGDDGSLTLNILPAISAMWHHDSKRSAAGCMFEIAAKYAEKVGGTVVQHANVIGCQLDGSSARVLAQYPLRHLDFTAICPGFQTVFLGGSHVDQTPSRD